MVGIFFAGACSGLSVVQIVSRQQQALKDHQPVLPLLGVVSAGVCWAHCWVLRQQACFRSFVGWVCCRSILVVGCGVCFVDSGCEHLASKACVLFVFAIFVSWFL